MAKKQSSPADRQKLRKQYEESQSGSLRGFAGLLGQSFQARVNLLAQLIRNVHHPSLGTYKERLLSSVIREFIPKAYEVGTGFVMFPVERDFGNRTPSSYERLNTSDFALSQQCDLLVYDANTTPVIFKDGDFVVLRPESVRAVVEVKGTLDSKQVAEIVRHAIDFGRKWAACRRFYNLNYQGKLHQPTLCALAWQIGVNKKGIAITNASKIRAKIFQLYRHTVSLEETRGLPLLDKLLVYNDSCTGNATHGGSPDDPRCSFGWYTSCGRFVERNEAETLCLGRDKTIAMLLDTIQSSLGTTINRFFRARDEDWLNASDLFPHGGYTPWIFDAETVRNLNDYD
jgi:hypothetical protein